MTQSLWILPATRVAELLDAYPALEEVLVEQAPAFKALKNPVLRRTVARVATLSQAAKVGGVPLRQLIVALRQAAGQPLEEFSPTAASPTETELTGETVQTPAWLDEARVRAVIDADALLAAGDLPLAKVQHALGELSHGEIVKLTSGFRPEPLLAALQKCGIRTHVQRAAPTTYHTYVLCERPDR